ncbi:MAG: DUF2089 family protein [Planctomycetota bacterium]|jgi:hypothetical protein
MDQDGKSIWLGMLSVEDVAFIKRFILASGSLKELASVYEVSYPTIRLRLDRLIAKVQVLDEQRDASEFEKRLSLLYAEGRIDESAFNKILDAYEQERETER